MKVSKHSSDTNRLVLLSKKVQRNRNRKCRLAKLQTLQCWFTLSDKMRKKEPQNAFFSYCVDFRQKKINEKLAKILRCNFFGNVRTCSFWKIRSIFFQSAKFYAKTTVSIAYIAISKKKFFWGQLSLMGCNLNFVKIF